MGENPITDETVKWVAGVNALVALDDFELSQYKIKLLAFSDKRSDVSREEIAALLANNAAEVYRKVTYEQVFIILKAKMNASL